MLTTSITNTYFKLGQSTHIFLMINLRLSNLKEVNVDYSRYEQTEIHKSEVRVYCQARCLNTFQGTDLNGKQLKK